MELTYKNVNGGDQVMGLPAQVVGEELQRIRAVNGGELQAEDVVAAAKSSDNPLHEVFNFGNVRGAAEAHWLWVARQLIRDVIIVVVKGKEQVRSPLFINIPAQGNRRRHYQSTLVAVRHESEWNAALAELQSKVHGIQTTISRLRAVARMEGKDAKPLETVARHFERGNKALSGLLRGAA